MSWVQLLAWSVKSTSVEFFGVTVGKTVSAGITGTFASPSVVQFRHWFDFEREYLRAAEFHSELVLEMEMESHGRVSIMKAQSQHKTTGQSLWREPLSARSELHSHPLAEHAQACTRLPKAEVLEGPMAPDHWWLKLWKKLHLSRVILVLGVMLIFSVSFNGREREKKNP